MKERKSKKAKESEIKITNYMDDFNEEIDKNDDKTEIEKMKEIMNSPLEETPKIEEETRETEEDEEESLDDIDIPDDEEISEEKVEEVIEEDEKEFDDEDLIPEKEIEDVEERFEGSLDDIEVDDHVNKEIKEKKEKEEKINAPKKRKRYRLKKSAYILLIIIVIIIFAIIQFVKRYNYMHSNEYYLLEKGYTKEEVTKILASKELTTMFLERDYNSYLLDLLNEKYYLSKNLEKYISYKEKNTDKSLSEVVQIINVGLDRDWYDNSTPTDTSKNELMLVNKFNYLEKEYQIEDLKEMSVRYAFSGRKLRENAYNAFIEMANAAKESNLKIVAYTTYRTYEYQESQYNRYKNQKGLAYADTKAARPGYSDHQTGLGIDISTLDSTIDFETTEEFTWLKNNAYRYGFIMRYPKDKENITGFNYEPYHYRYVGKEAAAVIYRDDITLEEYYAYYVEGNN